MADPILQQNPVTINFVDTSPAVSQPVPVTAANPLPVTIGTGGDPTEVVGNVAHDAVDSGNPVKIGGYGSANAPTAVQVGDRVNAWFNLNGSQAVMPTTAGGVVLTAGTTNDDALATSAVANQAITNSWLRLYNGSTGSRWAQASGATGTALVENGPYTASRVTGDGQIKATAGFIHTVSIAPTTATPTAGLLTIYNSAAESGTIVYSEWIFATTVGHTITLDVLCGTGIYVGFDATLANVSCTVSFR